MTKLPTGYLFSIEIEGQQMDPDKRSTRKDVARILQAVARQVERGKVSGSVARTAGDITWTLRVDWEQP